MRVRTGLIGVLAAAAVACAERRDRGEGESQVAAPPAPAASTRAPALDDAWYPSERAVAMAEVEHLLRRAARAPAPRGRPVALVVPHAAWRYSGPAAAAAYRLVRAGDASRVVVLGPAHRLGFRGFALPAAKAFTTPLGDVPVCGEADALVDGGLVAVRPEAHVPENSIEVELPFLQARLGAFCIVPLLAGVTTAASEHALGERLARLADGRTLFVFSSDLVHYGPRFSFTPFGPSARAAREPWRALEDRVLGRLVAGDGPGFRALVDAAGATICGRQPLGVLLELLAALPEKPTATLLAHYASTDLDGAEELDGVGYGSAAYLVGGGEPAGEASASTRGSAAAAPPVPALGAPPAVPVRGEGAPPLRPETTARLLRVARAALGTELGGTNALARELRALPDDPALDARQAVFVTLTRGTEVRGCTGQVAPTYPLVEATVRAALGAAREDPRFPRVTAAELPTVSISVTLLGPTRRVTAPEEIRIGTHGVVLEAAGRRSLFLPAVPAAAGWSKEDTLARLAEKVGLAKDAHRRPDAVLSVFEAEELREEPAIRVDAGAAPVRPLRGGAGPAASSSQVSPR